MQPQFPGSFLHWEDFGRDNARRILEHYQADLCTFNDDMQGTGAVTVSALLAACRASGRDFADQRIVIFGAGTAGAGIADQICTALQMLGLSAEQARSQCWFIDRPGLLLNNMDGLMPFQVPYARDAAEVSDGFRLADGRIDLNEVIRQVRPTTLIGCSTQTGAFSSSVLNGMAASVERPIIFPLSNPTSLAEATPEAILEATHGQAMIATGSPFGSVTHNGEARLIAQCNNALVFPGIGLGVVAIGAQQLTDNMLWAACQALSDASPALQDPAAPLLPPLGDALEVSLKVAVAVAQQAIDDGVATAPDEGDIASCIEAIRWYPEYLPYQYRTQR